MKDQERLEEIKEKVTWAKHECEFHALYLTTKDIEYLIQQAEDNQRLKGKNNALITEKEGLEEQNKRYEEVLKFYENEDNYEFATIVTDCDIEIESEIFDDRGNKARKALQNK